jgi:hypothetical protein
VSNVHHIDRVVGPVHRTSFVRKGVTDIGEDVIEIRSTSYPTPFSSNTEVLVLSMDAAKQLATLLVGRLLSQ